MLITFSSSATSDLVMFDDVARHLLDVLGKTAGSVGVIMPSEFPEALQRLAGIPVTVKDARRARELAEIGDDAANGIEPHDDVELKVRAHPLVAMIRQARVVDAPIVWHAATAFSSDGKATAEGGRTKGGQTIGAYRTRPDPEVTGDAEGISFSVEEGHTRSPPADS